MPRYNAFISYTHRSEMPLAVALDKALTRFAKPWNRLRAMRLYRDVESQALTPDLLAAVERAMDDSEFLILLASPTSAASAWVPREVEHWVKTRPVDRLLIVVCDGEIAWDREAGDFDWEKTTCLPPTLRGVFKGSPLYLDMRWARGQEEGLNLDHPQFKDNVARLAATVNGKSKEDMLSEEVTQFRRTARIRNAAIATLSVLLVATAIAAAVAVHQRNQAIMTSLRIQVQNELDNNRLGRAVQIARAARERFGDRAAVRDMGWRTASHTSAVVHEFQDLGSDFARFSPDGTRLLTGLYVGDGLVDVIVQDRLGGNAREFKGLRAAHFLPDGSGLLLLDPAPPRELAFSGETPDGEVVQSRCTVPGGRVYDFASGATVDYEGEWFGDRVQVCGDLVRVFDAAGRIHREIWLPGARRAATSADGLRVAVETGDDRILVIDEDGQLSAQLPGQRPVLSPDGSLIATVTVEHVRDDRQMLDDGRYCTLVVNEYDRDGPWGERPPDQVQEVICERPELRETLSIRGHTRVFTAAGEEVARLAGTHPFFAFDGIVTLHDVEVYGNWEKHPYWHALRPDAQPEREIELYGFEAVPSPDGNWIASGERFSEETFIWHRSGRFHARVEGGMPVWVPGQPMLLTTLWGQARIWHVERLRSGSRKVLADVIGVPPAAMDAGDDIEFWAECGAECEPDPRYAEAATAIEALQQDSGCDVQSIRYQGNLMLTACGADGTWRLHDLEADGTAGGAAAAAIMTRTHGPGLQQAGFSPDGNWIIGIGIDGLARLWDVSSGDAANLPIDLPLGKPVLMYAFSPDSQLVVLVPYAGVARLWDTEGVLVASFPLRDSREMFRGARFFNDGRHLVFAGTSFGDVNFYAPLTSDLDALYEEFSWVPRLPADELVR